MRKNDNQGQGQQPINKNVCHKRDIGVHNKGSKARPCHVPMPRRVQLTRGKKERLSLIRRRNQR